MNAGGSCLHGSWLTNPRYSLQVVVRTSVFIVLSQQVGGGNKKAHIFMPKKKNHTHFSSESNQLFSQINWFSSAQAKLSSTSNTPHPRRCCGSWIAV